MPRLLWWLSFADEGGFLGGLVIDGLTFVDALENATRRGLNPGGEVKAVMLDETKGIAPYVEGRIYSREEIDAIDGAVLWNESVDRMITGGGDAAP